jgi:hypothetical protein
MPDSSLTEVDLSEKCNLAYQGLTQPYGLVRPDQPLFKLEAQVNQSLQA